MGLERKLKRTKQKKFKKDVKTFMGLYDKIPNKCLTCDAPYDKNNKEHVKTWSVAVREKQGKVNLYCPTCWNKAKSLLDEIRRDLNDEKTDQ
tara:strand:+ start:72 stop:347 length:276 start_codon:yes stop_codon:yes gene_type:complete